MQSHQREWMAVNAQTSQSIQLPCGRKAFPQRIDHQIAYDMNPLPRDALIEEIPPAAFFSHQQDVGNCIRYEAVYFFRHAPVEASKPSLDAEDRTPQLDRDYRSRHP